MVAAVVYLGIGDESLSTSMTLGDLLILGSALTAGVACARAARRGTASRRAWTLLAIAAFIWSAAHAINTFYGITHRHVYPFPSIADAGFMLYSIPAIAGLFAFPRPPALLISRLRGVLDVLVITVATVFVTWGTVMHPARQSVDIHTIAGVVSLAYPTICMTIAAVVLTLGMRQRRGDRLRWLLLGAGFVTLAIVETVYVRTAAAAAPSVSGTPLAGGWMTACLLITLATLVPSTQAEVPPDGGLNLGVQLVPYLPVLAAVVVAAGSSLLRDPFDVVIGLILLLLVSVRQVMIVYENVNLTRGLEAKVAARTAELNMMTTIATAKTEQMEAAEAIASVGSWEWRPDSGAVNWSPEFYRILGLSPDCTEADFDLFTARVHPDDLEAVERFRAGIFKGAGKLAAACRIVRPDGTIRNVQARVDVFEAAPGEQPIRVGTMQDVTELLKMERMKDQFISVVSHELRTPLTSIRGVLGLLAGGALGPVTDKALGMIKTAVASAERLTRLINEILDVEQIAAGKLRLERANQSARDLIVTAVGEMLPIADQAGVTVVIGGCDGAVSADKDRIVQTLTNLVSNAIRFSTVGGAVTVASVIEDTSVRFTVTDHGRGIPGSQLETIFDRFAQVDSSDAREKDGSGLGLHICRGIVEQHGGRIWAYSDDQETVVAFTLPRGTQRD